MATAEEPSRLGIVREGRSRKFIECVEQITFSGSYAAEIGQPVFYATERCVGAAAARVVATRPSCSEMASTASIPP